MLNYSFANTDDALREFGNLGGGDDMLDFAATGEFVVGNFGSTVQNQQYLLGGSGPPYRDLLESGISLSAGTDASAISPMSPWI